MAWPAGTEPAHSDAGGCGQPAAAGTQPPVPFVAHRRPLHKRCASPVAARAWDWLKGRRPTSGSTQSLAGSVGMRGGAEWTRRVCRYACFVWGALTAGGSSGAVRAASVPWSLCAVPARLSVLSQPRCHAITALGPPGIHTAGPHGVRAPGHPTRRRAHGGSQRPRGCCKNAQP